MNESAMAYLLIVCIVLLALNQAHGRVNSNVRNRRETKGLFPFPRVGRRGGEIAWMLDTNDSMDRLIKRQGLMAFPRIGRSENPYDHRVTGDALWIGPRLGRDAAQLNAPTDISPWTLITLREYAPQIESEARSNSKSREPTQEELFDYDIAQPAKQQDISSNISH